uniref:Putative secreted protein n=1 Tax=Ixodes ricinus TaxID=34613 RepID=A0A6B0UL39_IXORI
MPLIAAFTASSFVVPQLLPDDVIKESRCCPAPSCGGLQECFKQKFHPQTRKVTCQDSGVRSVLVALLATQKSYVFTHHNHSTLLKRLLLGPPVKFPGNISHSFMRERSFRNCMR